MESPAYEFGQVRAQLTDITNQVAFSKERVILHKHGKEFVALIPLDDLHMLEAMEEAADLKAYRKGIKSLEENGGVSLAQAKKELGL